MQQYLTYLCTDINETGPSLVVFLRVDQLYVLRFLFCRVKHIIMFLLQMVFNPLVTNGFSHLYTLDDPIFSFRGIRSNFLILFHFLMKIMSANRIAPDGMPRFVWGFSVCVFPIKRMPGLYGLKNKAKSKNHEIYVIVT